MSKRTCEGFYQAKLPELITVTRHLPSRLCDGPSGAIPLHGDLKFECHFERLFLQNHGVNGMDSFQLVVRVFDTYVVWYLLVLPSQRHAVASKTSWRTIDGDTSYRSHDANP